MAGRTLKNLYHWVTSWVYVVLNGFPASKLVVIGVTGTDGKTTTSHLIYDILNVAGVRVALVSTVGARMGEEEIDTGFHVTNPDAGALQPLLRKIVDRGFTHLVLEVTSHGLDQNRLVGIPFTIAVLTNVTHEHLDYHGTLANYLKAKAKLMRGSRYSILNSDDDSFDYLSFRAGGEVIPYAKTEIKVTNPKLWGDYNKYNIGAAQATVKKLGINPQVVEHVVNNFSGVPGRREEVELGQKFRALIDFAHTPNSLKLLLEQLRSELLVNGWLILVFGCPSLRDATKRPIMGKIAAELADKIIITAEDPRTESLEIIYQQITANLTNVEMQKVVRQDDRQQALNQAVHLARVGDIVVATGKGHEKSMCFGKTEVPWSDREAMEQAIKKVM